VVGDGFIEYTNVSRDDAHVLQCNASNEHGYLFTNAFLNVLGTTLPSAPCRCHWPIGL